MSEKDLPKIYDIKPGTIGKTQGDRKLKTPAKKAIVKGISWVMNFYSIVHSLNYYRCLIDQFKD
jgi:hypothetical protein